MTTNTQGKKRQLVFVEEINPNSFVLLFEKGDSGKSWSVRDYSVPGKVSTRYANEFRLSLTELRKKAGQIFDAPPISVNDVQFWSGLISDYNKRYLSSSANVAIENQPTIVNVTNDLPDTTERNMSTQKHSEAAIPEGDDATQTAAKWTGDYIGAVFKPHYRIEKELGRGNIGVVYLARDQKLHGRPVVVKVLLDNSSENEWFRKKFRQEIEALSKLDHPGIVGPVDLGETPDGKSFIAMQYVQGTSLRSKIEANGMKFDDVATIIRQAGQALSAAHAAGIVHCDLKPENIMLQDLGEGQFQTKIVDFGIAKVENSQIAASTGTTIAGTPHYMSPEQVEGNPTEATDIFALGVIAYEMLTGRRPFNPPTQYMIRETILEGPKPKPKVLRPELTKAAETIVLKAMAFDATDRFKRARDFGELLAQALTTDLELGRESEAREEQDLELAHVLFMDIVGYSKLPTDQQTQIVIELQQIVTATETYQSAKRPSQLIIRSTGDGMALVFFSGPKAAVECAVEIAKTLRSRPHIPLRMGINTGPVIRVKDLNGTVDVAGAGINMAQRVMDCGDDGHILLSKSVADVLTELGEWRDRIHDLGERKVKHRAVVHVYNLRFGEVGSPRRPEKLSSNRRVIFAIASLAIIVAAGTVVVLNLPARNASLSDPKPISKADVAPAENERSLSYWLTMQRYCQGRPCEKVRLPGACNISEENFDIGVNALTSEPGYFYLLGESTQKLANGDTRYIIYYPSPGDQPNATSQVEIPELQFDKKTDVAKLWLVWSERPLAELEAVKALANARDMGKINDATKDAVIDALLKRYSALASEPRPDEANRKTDIKTKGDVIVYLMNF